MKKWLLIIGAGVVVLAVIAALFGAFGGGFGNADGFGLSCDEVQGSRVCKYVSKNVLPSRFIVDIRPETVGTDKALTIRESSGAQCQFLDPVDRLPVLNSSFACGNGAPIPQVNYLLAVALQKPNDLFTFDVKFVTPPPATKSPIQPTPAP